MIPNSWRLMTDDKVRFPKTPLTVGAKQGSEIVTGGFGQLPNSIQQVLRSQPGGEERADAPWWYWTAHEDEVFAMLVEEQVALVPRCGEERREVVPADDGIGVVGLLVLDIPAREFGALDSLSRSRIIRYGPQTIVAQLTLTAPQSAPVNWAEFALTVRPGAAPVGVSVQVGAPADSDEHV